MCRVIKTAMARLICLKITNNYLLNPIILACKYSRPLQK